MNDNNDDEDDEAGQGLVSHNVEDDNEDRDEPSEALGSGRQTSIVALTSLSAAETSPTGLRRSSASTSSPQMTHRSTDLLNARIDHLSK